MGGFAQTCIKILIGWIESFVSQVWSFFSNREGDGLIAWIGEHWKGLILVLCLIGAIADMAVYLFRWEPFKVWKSFFKRRKMQNRILPVAEKDDLSFREYGSDISDENPERTTFFAVNQKELSPDMPEDGIREDVSDPYPEFIRSERPGYESVFFPPNMPTPPEYREMFRRPRQDTENLSATKSTDDSGSLTERNLEKLIGPRRRRLRINELFGNQEEGVVHYEAPQPVIDQKEAYHTPVYPRNWKENGDIHS